MSENETPKVSVIIPFYNSELYVSKCLESLLNQNYENFEIIAVDDGSSDETYSKLKEYAEFDSRIKCVKEENQGRSKARNIGVSMSGGKYITFVDSDDYVSSTYLSDLVNGSSDDKDIVMVNIMNIDVQGNPLNEKKKYSNLYSTMSCKEGIKQVLHQKPGNEICGKLFRKELFEGLEFPEKKIYEDLYMTFALMCKAKKVVFLDSPDYFYLQRSDNTMNSEFKLKNMDILDMGKKAKRVILDKYPDLEKDVAGRLFAAYSNVWMKVNKDTNKEEYELLWSEIRKNRSKILLKRIDNKKVLFGIYASLLGPFAYRFIYKCAKR